MLLKVTIFILPSSAEVILVFPLYHWYLAAGVDFLATHVNDSGFPDMTLIERVLFMAFGCVNNTLSTGPETKVARLINVYTNNESRYEPCHYIL